MRVLFAGQDRFLWSECCFDMISLRENASGFFESRSAKNSSTVCVFFGVFLLRFLCIMQFLSWDVLMATIAITERCYYWT